MAKIKHQRKSKLDPYLDQIGILPDRQIAEMAGVTSENVRAYRNRRGIPAQWRGEGDGAEAPVEEKPARARKPAGRKPRKAAAPAAEPVVETAEAAELPPEPEAAELPPEPVVEKPARKRTRPAAPAAPATPAAPAAVEPVAEPKVGLAQGFSVTVETRDGQEEFVVVGADIAQASMLALQSLTKRFPGARISSIRFLAEALIG